MDNLNGILVVYKEKGCTSFDVVHRLREILGIKKIGHTGTLDPDAEGVLVVCLGNATKLCGMITDSDKQYVAQMRFGIRTDTLDMSGKILSETDASEIPEDEIREAIYSFVGEYDQVPPMYSAIKQDGRKLVDLARKGIEVERKSRRVVIKDIEIISVRSGENPGAEFKVDCSKGTYIRSLVSDIGERLGCGAAMSGLIRTRAAGFSADKALKTEKIEEAFCAGNIAKYIIPTEMYFSGAPKTRTIPAADKKLMNGNSLSPGDFRDPIPNQPGLVRIYFSDGRFAAVYKTEGARLVPWKMFLPAR